MRYAVIVDPIYSGQQYPLAFCAAGCRPVAVLSAAAVAEQPTWHAERFEHVHRFDGDLEELAARLRAYEPSCVIPGSESGVELADALVELVVPGSGNRPELTAARRDKWAMTRALARAGIPHLRQLCTDDPAQVADWLRATGLESESIVLKPPRSSGADNVHLVPASADWRPAFNTILGAENLCIEVNAAVLVSEYAEGTELLIDSYSVNGSHGLVNVGCYTKRQFDDRIGIYDCVEFLAPGDPQVQAAWPYTRRVLDAVGIRNGCGHTEVMLTPRGPRLIEIAARPAGGEHQRCSEIATGDSQIRRTVAHRERGEFTSGYQLVKYLRNVLISAPNAGIWHNAEIFDGIDALRSYHTKHVPYGSGDLVPATRDVLTILAWVVLTSPDRDAVDADYRQIKAWEDRLDIRSLVIPAV